MTVKPNKASKQRTSSYRMPLLPLPLEHIPLRTTRAWNLCRPTLVFGPFSSSALIVPHQYRLLGINLLQASSNKTFSNQVLHLVLMQGPSDIRFNHLLCWESCHILFRNCLFCTLIFVTLSTCWLGHGNNVRNMIICIYPNPQWCKWELNLR